MSLEGHSFGISNLKYGNYRSTLPPLVPSCGHHRLGGLSSRFQPFTLPLSLFPRGPPTLPQLLHPCRHFFFPLSGGGGRESEEKLQTPGLSLSSPPTLQRRSPGGEEDARATAGRRGDNARSPPRAWSRRPLKLSAQCKAVGVRAER